MTEHDRDEWTRPWRAGDSPAVLGRRTPAAGGMSFVNDPLPDADVTAAPDGAPGPARPFPQPPPPEWDDRDEGPGSPLGSVRPPDTTGTVDAPAVTGGGAGGRGRSGITTALVAALVGAVLGTAGTLAVVRTTPAFSGAPAARAPLVTTEGDASGDRGVVPAVAQAVTPSVVRVDVLASEGTGTDRVVRAAGLGSGVIYRSDGYVITNHHVVVDADALRVRLANGDSLDAEVVGSDPLNDLAVLKIDRSGLPAINLRESPGVVVGETAIAIGSPFGLDASVTAGVVSAMNRDIQVPDPAGALVIPAVIQTDAAINPGNSGGALVDANGRLIGINTAILSGTGGNQGVGFAIPVAQAIASADELIDVGFVRHAFLGITGVDLTPEVAARFDLDVDGGAVVDSVQEGSAADEAGLEANDIIVAVDGRAIGSMSDLVVALRSHDPGETVAFEVVREGERMRIEATLDERPR